MTSQKKVKSVSITNPDSVVQEETYTTDDLHCCAALVCAGHNLIRFNGDLFVLRRNNNIERDVRAFWSNTLIVPARSYADEIEMLLEMFYGN